MSGIEPELLRREPFTHDSQTLMSFQFNLNECKIINEINGAKNFRLMLTLKF